MDKPVLFVCKDPGGTNGVLPVYEAWVRGGGRGVLIANGKALELLPSRGIGFRFYSNPEAVLAEIPHPAALVTSMCSKGGIGRDLVPLLAGRCPRIALLDYWSAPFRRVDESSWAAPEHRPDAVVVNDAFGVACVRSGWGEGWHPERAPVLGYPALDAYAMFDAPTAVTRVNDRLRIGAGEYVVLFTGWAGQAMAWTVAALHDLAERYGIRVTFIPREHPRLRVDGSKDFAQWQSSLATYTAGRCITDSSAVETRDLLARADLVIADRSTTLMEAVVLRRSNVLIMDAADAEKYEQSTGLSEFPLVALGATVRAATPAALVDLLVRAQMHGLGLAAAQEAAFRIDGRNAERVAAYLGECIRSHRSA